MNDPDHPLLGPMLARYVSRAGIARALGMKASMLSAVAHYENAVVPSEILVWLMQNVGEEAAFKARDTYQKNFLAGYARRKGDRTDRAGG